jgi:hypothetical protein
MGFADFIPQRDPSGRTGDQVLSEMAVLHPEPAHWRDDEPRLPGRVQLSLFELSERIVGYILNGTKSPGKQHHRLQDHLKLLLVLY